MAAAKSKTALITGIGGQDGLYMAELLLARGYNVVGTSHRADAAPSIRISETEARVLQLNLADLEQIKKLVNQIRPDEIYNLASRSSSTQLFDDPIATTLINGLAVVGFLEVLRTSQLKTRFCQASSSEIFANGKQSPQDEESPMIPRNAYGAAKLFAHNMIGAYRARFGVFACSAILFNHESPRRGTEYVTRKITRSAARISRGLESTLKLGNLDSRRDWGAAVDYVRAMWLMLQHDAPEDFVIATGRTHTVGELCEAAFSRVGLNYRKHVVLEEISVRGPETVELRGNPAKAASMLGWKSRMSFEDMIGAMVDADLAALALNPPAN